MALALMATGAFAQDAQQNQPGTTPPAATAGASATTKGMPMGSMAAAPGGMPRMEGMPRMGMMQVMMGQGGMAGHIEGRVAFLKTELKITDAQLPLWNAVADAMRASAKDIGMPNCMSMMQSSGTLPEKLAAREKAMTDHLEAFRKLAAAAEPLYAALNDEQKKTADELLIGPMGIMGVGMM